MTTYGVEGVTVVLVYWILLSVEGTLRLDLRVEEYTGCFVNIDEYELPNGSTLLDRDFISHFSKDWR